jgi:predicted GIY-YIG superfamily endonuclease
MTYLYVILGPTGKAYVGITNNPKERWRQHRKCKKAHPLYRAMKKYGRDAFTMEIVSSHPDLVAAKAAEISLIAMLNSADRSDGYNISPGGDYDALTGPIALRHRLSTDPTFYAAYSLRSSEVTRGVWASRSPKRKRQIFDTISATLKRRCAEDPAFKALQQERMLAARAKGDVRQRAEAASRGIKQFWVDLRADPDRYADYIARRRETLQATNRAKKA